MSIEEIIDSVFIVPKYNKDIKLIEIHLSNEHDEVIVVINNNTIKFTYVVQNPFEICFQKSELHCE